MIRLARVSVLEAPGLPDGVEIASLEPGLNLILGPNASGKSTLVRVVLGGLWPGEGLEALRAKILLETDAGPATAFLRSGKVAWNPGRPALPPEEVRPLLALDLRSLLEGSGPGQSFSRRLAVELMAGYDLETALADFKTVTPRRGPHQEELETARATFRDLEHKAAELARQQDMLESLRQQRDQAREAQELASLARDAAELAGRQSTIDGLEAQIATFPPGLDALHEDDAGELESLETALDGARGQLEKLVERQERSRAKMDRLRLPGRHPEAHEVKAWRKRADELEDIARRLATLEKELAGARARRDEAREGLGSWEPPAGALPTEALERLEGALDERERARARVRELEEAARFWDRHAGEEPAAGTRQLDLGIDALRSWLRAAPVGRLPAWPGWVAALAGAAVALAAALPLAVGTWFLPAGLLLLGAGGGYLAALALVRRRLGGGHLGEAVRRAGEAGLTPASWEEDAVRERLRQAEEERDRLLLQARAAHRAGEVRAALESAREELEKAEAVPGTLALSLGLAPGLPDLRLIEAARRVGAWREACQTVAPIEGEIEILHGRLQQGLGELGAWFDSLGLAAPEDARAATAAVEELAQRLTEMDALSAAMAETDSDLGRARERIAHAEAALESFWNRTGIEGRDPQELRRRLEHLPEYLKLEKELAKQRAQAAGFAERLRSRGAWERLGLDPESFTEAEASALAEHHAAAASEYQGLVTRITKIETDIEKAQGATTLEEARARWEQAARELAEYRDLAMENVLARFLIQRARETHRMEHAPPVLRRARSLFADFTRDAFHLDVEAGGTLFATDTALGARRSLEELSDGTRIHLLLAARLAAVEEAEGAAGPLPIFLDEALATTDPGRFAEIAAALLTVASEGRQILYLTADPAEVEHWRRACRGAGLEPPEPLRLGTPAPSLAAWDHAPAPGAGAVPEIPPPGDLDAAAWARKLGVPPPEPRRPPGAWHVLYLLPDHLETVHRLLQLGYPQAGPLVETLRSGGLRTVLEDRDRALLLARSALLTATLELRAQGRGRRVTWGDVAASGAVSSKYEDRVRELVESHGSDPAAFLEAVGGLHGFRRAKLGSLEDHLRSEGVLPDGEPLTEEQIVAGALDRTAKEMERAGIDAAAAAAYVRSLLRLLQR